MEEKKSLKKALGLVTLTSLGVGSMIGSGIFALPAAMSVVAGPSLIFSILIAGIITTFLAIAYAELGAAFPLTGGPYSLPRLAMGDLGGFIMGWGYFIYLFIGTAAVIDIFVVYLGFYIPGLAIGERLTSTGISIALIALWVFTIINILGVKWGGLYSLITTVGKLLPLFIFGLVGLKYVTSSNFTPFFPMGFGGVTIAITLFFWSYTGFESIVIPSEEITNPSRTIPLAMIMTMLITIVVYIFIACVFVGMIDWSGLHLAVGDWSGIGKLSSPLADISMGLGLPVLAAIATVGAIIATAGAGGDWVLLQGRLPFAMAHDALFLSSMAKVNKRFGTPAASLIFTSVLTSIVLIAIPNFPSVALIASVAAIVPYAAAAISVPILRRTKASTPRPFRLPFATLVTLLGFIFATFLIYWASWPWTGVGALLILSAYPAFLFVRRKNLELKRNAWVPVYMAGIVGVSLIGDKHFSFNNFTPWSPLGILRMPYDLIVLAIFATLIYVWVYKVNVKKRETSTREV
ncbi:MAG: APC family permease [Pseudomonadota bacterium]